jgi:hypothetical protein
MKLLNNFQEYLYGQQMTHQQKTIQVGLFTHPNDVFSSFSGLIHFSSRWAIESRTNILVY